MASNPAMLLDPKSFKKRQKAGTDTPSPSPPDMGIPQANPVEGAANELKTSSLSSTTRQLHALG